MIKVTDSTVFNVGADCIVNTVNCVGFMGKGVALEFALRYPELERIYIEQCKKKEIHTGQVYFYEVDGQKVINFPTKFHFKYPSQIEWIENGLKDFAQKYKQWNITSVAFPLLGASNGGLNPIEVETLMVKYLEPLDIEVFICRSRLLEGKELEMVNRFKEINIPSLKSNVRLTSKQIETLENNQKFIKRFYDILSLDGIGIDTYKAIFTTLYNDNPINEQLSLF